ncbi:hypothetical protein Pelo_7666 [Pelomyxa schiedti]|nr:hypothetical protein Pelo_7666 [Pelomyxa schiedti]
MASKPAHDSTRRTSAATPRSLPEAHQADCGFFCRVCNLVVGGCGGACCSTNVPAESTSNARGPHTHNGDHRSTTATTSSSSTTTTACDCDRDTANDVNNCTEDEHERSAVHMFCKIYKEKHTPHHFYAITEANKGYQMMVNSLGWDEERGLGANCQGPLDPVATQFRHDRAGLGSGRQPPARVTHKDVNDTVDKLRAQQRQKRRQKKQPRLSKTQKREQVILERQSELELRRYLYD